MRTSAFLLMVMASLGASTVATAAPAPAAAVAPQAAAAPQASAAPQLAYSNMGPTGAGYDFSQYYLVSGPSNHALTYAVPFVASVTGFLDHIDLPLYTVNPNSAVAVSIFPDAGGVPATYNHASLEEWLETKLPLQVAVKFPSKHRPILVAGTIYWIVVAPVFYDGEITWAWNTTGATGVFGTVTGGYTGGWAPYTAGNLVAPAFDVWVKS